MYTAITCFFWCQGLDPGPRYAGHIFYNQLCCSSHGLLRLPVGLLDTALDSAVSASVAGEAIVSVARLAALSPTVSPFPPPLLLLQRQWYETDSEYYLLQFTLTVRCLFYTSFSLELCRQPVPAPAPAQRTPSSFLWLLAYVFYYPVFHNGPILNFPEFFKQVELSVYL